jgi:hypothetical protein
MTPRAHPQQFATYSTLGTAQRWPQAKGVAYKEEDSHKRASVVDGMH